LKVSKSENTKLRILEAAEIEFSEKGIFGARVDEIALKAGINKRMLYEYFGNKEELYKTVLYNVYKRIADIDEKILSTEKDSIESFKEIIVVYYEFLAMNPTFVRMIMWENLNNGKYIEEFGAMNIKDPAVKAIKNIIYEGKKKGVFKEEIDEQQVVLSLITFSFSYFSNIHTLSLLLKIDMISKENIKKRTEHVSEIILNYLIK